ncbi:MAG: RHS repeat-associated core domain-containing protein [Candidatus Hydrogenedentes bacterium]|nr:RHS repeat-associated core domain-containing protein [Candidatus Hydrogenedentota bacterium]
MTLRRNRGIGDRCRISDNGNLTKVTATGRDDTLLAYDGMNRLTKVSSPGINEAQTTTYDLLGRVSARSTVSGGIMSHAYDKWRRVTAMNLGGTTTTQAYDAWGRLTGRAQGGYSATYAYPPAADLRRYGDKLYSVTSDFPGEGDVTYEYGGDQKRRSRVAGASETWYNYDMGWNVLSEEDDADGATGALTATNVLLTPGAEVSALLADIAGASPASGAPRYYVTDHLGSTRGAYDASGAAAGTYEYSPYGGAYAVAGDALETLSASFTGKPWDADSNLYHFPYRMYSPERARWMTRDPLGMVDGPNVYAYVGGGVVMMVDVLGLSARADEAECYEKLRREFLSEVEDYLASQAIGYVVGLLLEGGLVFYCAYATYVAIASAGTLSVVAAACWAVSSFGLLGLSAVLVSPPTGSVDTALRETVKSLKRCLLQIGVDSDDLDLGGGYYRDERGHRRRIPTVRS